MSKKRLLFLAAALVMLCAACRFGDSDPEFRTRSGLLGTDINITIYDKVSEEVFREAFARVEEIHRRMDIHSADSEISRLNGAMGRWVDVSEDMLFLLEEARRYGEISGGAFDITVQPVVALWDITGEPRVPSRGEIEALLPHIGWQGIEVDRANGRARLADPILVAGMGAIAKGYACDEAARILRERGVKRAILDFGGNVYVLGKKDNRSDWRVGLRNPLLGEGGLIGRVMAADTSVVTSGGYERYFTRDGKSYHHILDPKTGYPADSGLLAVVVVCDESAQADALSTACFVLGAEKGQALIESLPGVEAIFIHDDKTIAVTEGLKDAFEIADERFAMRAVS